MTLSQILAMLAETGEGMAACDLAGIAGAEARRADRQAGPAPVAPGHVAVIPVEGVLTPRGYATWSGRVGGTIALRSAIASAAANADIGAIVLAVDSPGGTVMGTAETGLAVREAAARKPVIAFAAGMMASAAYWISSQASEVVAAPSAEIGSIGVIAMHTNFAGALEQMGVSITLQTAGRYKGEGHPFGPLGPEAMAARQARIDAAYEEFVAAVAAGRRTSPDAVRAGYGEGRVLDAGPSVAAGLADRVATFEETIAGLATGRPAASNRRPRRSALPFL